MIPRTIHGGVHRHGGGIPGLTDVATDVAEALDWTASAGPEIFRPRRNLPVAADHLAILGALWIVDQEGGCPVAWDGEVLRGDAADLIGHVVGRRAWRAGKAGVAIESRRGLAAQLRRQRADLWTGQVDLQMLWTTMAQAIDRYGPVEQATHVSSATGYDQRTVWISLDMGYGRPAGWQPLVRPVVECLAILGAEAAIRAGLWYRRWIDSRTEIDLPDIWGVPLRDWGDASRTYLLSRVVRYGERFAGRGRRYLTCGSHR